MGRKAKTLTEDQKEQVEKLAAYLTQDQMADYFGMTRPTLAAIMDRDEGVLLRYKRGKSRAIGAIANSLIQKARDGDTACMMFYLKTQAGWRETERKEIVGPEGGPLLIQKVERVVIDGK